MHLVLKKRMKKKPRVILTIPVRKCLPSNLPQLLNLLIAESMLGIAKGQDVAAIEMLTG